MIGLLTESYCNAIATETNLNKVSNIKKIMQALIEGSIYSLSYVENIDDNIAFKEVGTDLVSTIAINSSSETIFEKNSYGKTTIERYNYEHYNTALEITPVPYYEEKETDFIEELVLNCKGIKKFISWFIQDNFIVFYNQEGNGSEYFYEIDEEYQLYDFKIDSNYFVYMILGKGGKTYLVKTHLGLPFLELNKNECVLNEEKLFFKIEIEQSSTQLLYKKNNEFIFSDDEYNITQVKFGKKYYFEYNDKYYFNNIENLSLFKDSLIDTDIQLNNLNMYNYLSFLGLNDYQIKNRKISTNEMDTFLNLFKNKFDNTVNGGLNYFNTKVFNDDTIDNLSILRTNNQNKKDYLVNINDTYFNINGNFVYGYKKGNYKIEITSDTCSLYQLLGSDYVFEKSIKFDSINSFYFCNLKFEYKRYNTLDKTITYYISSNDGYTFVNKQIEAYSVETIPNNKSAINKLLTNSTVKGMENRKTNFTFDGKKIIFYNYFDYEEKKFKYGDKVVNVSINDTIQLKNIHDYYFDKSFVTKHNKIYFRNSGEFHYTTSPSFTFPLINENGYISDFWVENQGSTIYFRNSDDKIEITSNYNDCDFIVKIPKIEDYIQIENKLFGTVEIDDNDDLESEGTYGSDILITDKFMNEPLFYKVFIEGEIEVTVYDSDGKEVTNRLTETLGDGIVVYFNANANKLYYFNTEESEYNYFEPVKAFENIKETYLFDDNNEISFDEPRLINTFTLNSSKNISSYDTITLILYNNNSGDVNKIEITGDELNTIFDLELYADSVYIEPPKGYVGSDFSFSEIQVCSIISNDNILYLKSNRDDVVYYSKEVAQPDVDSIDFTKVKVYTKYTIDGTKLKESFTGNFIVNQPFADEIPILYKDNVTGIEASINVMSAICSDEFYNNNFKSPGIYLMDEVEQFQKIAETFNDDFDSSQIVENGGE
jgi:hypothetical protein